MGNAPQAYSFYELNQAKSIHMKKIYIDEEVLQNLYGNCQDSLNEVFSEFVSSYETMKQSLSSAFASGNLSSLRRLLHFYGPSYMYLGLPRITEMFKNMEHKSAQSGNHFALSSDFSELIQVMDFTFQEVTCKAGLLKQAV